MIDWHETLIKFGYNQQSLIGKRPKVVCKCDYCHKKRVITIRVKSRIKDGQMSWVCPSCVGKKRSKTISAQMRDNWTNPDYRENQIDKKQSDGYKLTQSTKSRQRWENPEYRKQIETGINITNYIQKSRTQFKQQFNYSSTTFGNWSDKISIVCNACNNHINISPQKHIEHGYCHKCGISGGQREIAEYLNTVGHQPIINDRTQLDGLELDIFLPANRLAIEFHGIYWHSYDVKETPKQKKRHQLKALKAADANITLLQFFDFEWDNHREIVQSMIKNKLGLSKKTNARDFKVAEIPNKIAAKFFTDNHIQGHRVAKTTLALLDNDNIMMAVSFSKAKDGYEIIRMATKINHIVRGGASRLLSHFKQEQLSTYADLRYSSGNAYATLGFKKISTTQPGYFYTKQKGVNYQILSRQQCQKHKLSKLLGNSFNPELSEAQNMFNHGYRRVWTAGNLYFQK